MNAATEGNVTRLVEIINRFVNERTYVGEGLFQRLSNGLKVNRDIVMNSVLKKEYGWRQVECRMMRGRCSIDQMTRYHQSILQSITNIKREFVFVCDEYGRSLKCLTPQRCFCQMKGSPDPVEIKRESCESEIFYAICSDGTLVKPLVTVLSRYEEQAKHLLGEKVVLKTNDIGCFKWVDLRSWISSTLVSTINEKRRRLNSPNEDAVVVAAEFYKDAFNVDLLKKNMIKMIFLNEVLTESTPMLKMTELIDFVVSVRYIDNQDVLPLIAANLLTQIPKENVQSCFLNVFYLDTVSLQVVSYALFKDFITKQRNTELLIPQEVNDVWTREHFKFNFTVLKYPFTALMINIFSTKPFLECHSVSEQVIFLVKYFPVLVKYFRKVDN
ncbi:hypothetical protein EIN_390900 [Entamoeba invadens IP1]|uniref:Uncharacterized protein n=1 Tax=Entamoeba invadens IP1 TaxID=370355 RepID=A0A0A1U581_ENTIV|nr:hypothetical protein EIN_390900 [Entamoeba invadens IP1]ELP89465.1 hypothetical protein EIN_390900 [Entamoeba invadens IP1]|eukprot:XP_004256236.1 hypothetical protein EIN_390900 [Entamoeba invadens IP1]